MTLFCRHCGRDFQRHCPIGALPKYCNDQCQERAKRARAAPLRKQRYRELRLMGATTAEASGWREGRVYHAGKAILMQRKAGA
jgi:hypothetical protein